MGTLRHVYNVPAWDSQGSCCAPYMHQQAHTSWIGRIFLLAKLSPLKGKGHIFFPQLVSITREATGNWKNFPQLESAGTWLGSGRGRCRQPLASRPGAKSGLWRELQGWREGLFRLKENQKTQSFSSSSDRLIGLFSFLRRCLCL